MKTKYVYDNTSFNSSYNEKCFREKRYRENLNTYLTFNNSPPPENSGVCEIMWKNMVERGRPQMILGRKRCACWTSQARDTHSE